MLILVDTGEQITGNAKADQGLIHRPLLVTAEKICHIFAS